MTVTDYIDVDDPTLREHIAMTHGVLSVTTQLFDALHADLNDVALRAGVQELIAKMPELTQEDHDNLSEVQHFAMKTIVSEFLPALKALHGLRKEWRQDLRRLVKHTYPIFENEDFTTACVPLKNDTHVIRVYIGDDIDIEKHTHEIQAMDDAEAEA